ncbi:MAG: flagellar assembly peptidoglycan hydrolase FlgJ [Aquimonas sp.]|nr:flagellar assembly peptidoglycan hydrolase FlgJ [Aquimonas sp.]
MKMAPPDIELFNRLATTAPARPRVEPGTADATADVARQFEALFVEQMLKTMRESAGGEALFPGQSGMFREMHDRELVKSITGGQGFGLAPQIERSLRQQQAALEAGTEPVRDLSRQPPGLPLDGYTRLLPAQRIPAEGGARPAAAILETRGPAREAGAGEPRKALPTSARPAAEAERAQSSARAGRLADTPEDFVRKVWPYAERAAEALGVDPRMLVAQAALETGWGRHVPAATDGRSGHNLFGIKAGRSWGGERGSHLTREFVDGRMQVERAEFRRYDSVAQSFQDYVGLLRGSARYAPALAVAGDSRAFAQALQNAGYATDPAYADKLTAIAHGPRLNRALAALAPPSAPAGTLLAQNLQESGAVAAGRGEKVTLARG